MLPDRITIYTKYHEESGKGRNEESTAALQRMQEERKKRMDKARRTRYCGRLSAGARKRLRVALERLLWISPIKSFVHPVRGHNVNFRLTFLTVTLPAAQGRVTDHDIYTTSFKPFLERLRRTYGVRNYVWRAERQKNGNLHYHIVTNQFLWKTKVQRDWNNYIARLGFVDRFREKHGHSNPPSTNIDKVAEMDELTCYMRKYMSKGADEEAVIHSKLWDCSKPLKAKIINELALSADVNEELQEVMCSGAAEVLYADHFFLLVSRSRKISEWYGEKLSKQLEEYLDAIKNWKEPERGRKSKELGKCPKDLTKGEKYVQGELSFALEWAKRSQV